MFRETNVLGHLHGYHIEAETKWPPFSRRHFQIDFLEWKCMINISLKFVPRGPINNIPTLVQVMAWRRPGDKPLSEPMLVILPTHICVTRPPWVIDPHPIVHRYFYTDSVWPVGIRPEITTYHPTNKVPRIENKGSMLQLTFRCNYSNQFPT